MKITEVRSDAIKEFVCTKQKRVDDLMKIASDFGFDLCELRKKYFREYSSDLANVNWDLVYDLKIEESQEIIPKLYLIWIFKKQIGEFKLIKDFCELNDEIIDEVALLHKLLPKMLSGRSTLDCKNTKSNKPDLIQRPSNQKQYTDFTNKLNRFNCKYGCLINLGTGSFGGLYTVIASITDTHRDDLQTIQNLLRLKIYAKSFAHFIKFQDHFKFQDQLSQKVKDLFTKVQINYKMTISPSSFLPFTSFENRMQLSKNSFKVIDQEYDKTSVVHFADLLLNECNLKKFKAKGMDEFDVIRLREHIWSFYKEKNYDGIKRRDTDLGFFYVYTVKSRLVKEAEHLFEFVTVNYKNDLCEHSVNLQKLFDKNIKSFKESVYNSIKSNEMSLDSLYKIIKYFETLSVTFKKPEFSKNKKLDLIIRVMRFFTSPVFKSSRHNPFFSDLFDTQNKVIHHQQSIGFDKISFETNESTEIRFTNLPSFYQNLLKSLEPLKEECIDVDFRKIINQHLNRLSDFIKKDSPENLINAISLSYYFDTYLFPLKLLKGNQQITYRQISEFYTFLKNKFDYLYTSLTRFEDISRFEKLFTDLIHKMFKRFIKNNDYRPRFRRLVSYLMVHCHFRFSDQFVIQHMLQNEPKYSNPLGIDKIDQIAKDISSKNLPPENKYFWKSSEKQPTDILKAARKICEGKEKIIYDDLVSANPEFIKDENADKSQTWKYILQQVLSRQSISKLSKASVNFKYSITEYILAIYLICDATCKRILANCLAASNSMIPFSFNHIFFEGVQKANKYLFLLPLSGINLELRQEKNTILINPYLYKSVKFSFFKDRKARRSTQKIVNNLFYYENPIYREDNITEQDFKDCFFTSFASKNDIGNHINCFDLSMIFLSNKRVNYNFLEENIHDFLCDISNVIVFLGSSESEYQAEIIREYLSKKNKTVKEADHTFFIELVECAANESLNFETGYFWHKKVQINPNDTDQIISL